MCNCIEGTSAADCAEGEGKEVQRNRSANREDGGNASEGILREVAVFSAPAPYIVAIFLKKLTPYLWEHREYIVNFLSTLYFLCTNSTIILARDFTEM